MLCEHVDETQHPPSVRHFQVPLTATTFIETLRRVDTGRHPAAAMEMFSDEARLAMFHSSLQLHSAPSPRMGR